MIQTLGLVSQRKASYLLFRPLLRGGGGELYTQMVFFVQTILADRYNNRTEL